MNAAQEIPVTVVEMEALVDDHRRLLKALEAKLAEIIPRPSAPSADSEAAVVKPRAGARQTRIARNEARRAARRAARRGHGGIWMPRPPHDDVQLLDLAGARASVWERTSEAMQAVEAGDLDRARTALEEILLTESALEGVIESMTVSRAWCSLQRELLHAGDDVVESVREALSMLEREPDARWKVGPVLSAAFGAQSHWLRVWRTFVQVAPGSADARVA